MQHVLAASALVSVSLLLCLYGTDPAVAIAAVDSLNLNQEESNSIATDHKTQNDTHDSVVKQVWEKRCGRQYNVGCLKLDLMKLFDRLDGSTNFQLFPGVSLVKSAPNSGVIPGDLFSSKSDSFLDNYLVDKFTNYLSSLTINVKVLDPAVVNSAISFGEGLFGTPNPETSATARKKNRFGNTIATAGLMSGATLMALGMSALAAMAGKALMTSLLSLMLSALAALKGHGDGGHKSTTYEIVTRPVVSHAHTHSSEVQHLSGHGGHGSHDAGYGYARSMASTPVQPVASETVYPNSNQYQNDEGSRLVYRGHGTLSSTGLAHSPASSSATPSSSSSY